MAADVLIAGAGPAGTLAAIVLARAGVKVTVFDRERFPRDKLCGDTLNPGAMAILRRLSLDHVYDGGLPIEGMILTGSGVSITGRYPGLAGRAITRRALDAALVSAARAAGADVQEGVLVNGAIVEERPAGAVVTGLRVRGRAGDLAVPASIVIAADGRASRVARGLGLSRFARRPRRWAAGAYFEGVAGRSSFGEMHVRAGRYLGVAPLPGGLTNACLVTSADAGLRDPSAHLQSAIRSDARLAERFAGARMVAPAVSMGPLAVECGAAGMPGLLLAGDVGGFVDPMTGDGLRFALRGAEQAAEAALEALAYGRSAAHASLSEVRRREFGRKWRFNRALRLLVGSPAAVRAATSIAPLVPALLRQIISYAGDCSLV